MMVDIDIPANGQIIHVKRPDGSTTLSVPRESFQAAVSLFAENADYMTRVLKADELVAIVKYSKRTELHD